MASLTKQLDELKRFDDRHRWLLDADLTYCAGRYLTIKDVFFFRPAGGYLLHQSAEKYLKSLRKVLLPDIVVLQHGHKLKLLLNDIKQELNSQCVERLTKAIGKIEPLKDFRYPDKKGDKSLKIMKVGLCAVDDLVACVRNEIGRIEI